MKRSGTADLPLHSGNVPRWLANRMTELGREILLVIASEFGKSEILTRLSDPFWFQTLGAVMGMDWHSSGITTSVIGALKRGINPISDELGIYICGGRGRYSRRTPDELTELAEKLSLDGANLVRSSKLSAKVDNTCVQDGYSLYLHSFILTDQGEWTVIQQGMNNNNGMARRYHWHSGSLKSFVSDPQTGISGINCGEIINMSDSRAANAQNSIIDFSKYHPDKQQKELRHLVMPNRHYISPADVNTKRLGAILALAYEQQFHKFDDLLLLKGLGPRTMQSLALISEIIYGSPTRFDDPARFAFAHGGKDGHPFPVPLKIYDKSIEMLKTAVNKAGIDHTEKVKSLRKLSNLSYLIEKNLSPEANVQATIAKERRESHLYGGRTVKGKAKKIKPDKTADQLTFFDIDGFTK